MKLENWTRVLKYQTGISPREVHPGMIHGDASASYSMSQVFSKHCRVLKDSELNHCTL